MPVDSFKSLLMERTQAANGIAEWRYSTTLYSTKWFSFHFYADYKWLQDKWDKCASLAGPSIRCALYWKDGMENRHMSDLTTLWTSTSISSVKCVNRTNQQTEIMEIMFSCLELRKFEVFFMQRFFFGTFSIRTLHLVFSISSSDSFKNLSFCRFLDADNSPGSGPFPHPYLHQVQFFSKKRNSTCFFLWNLTIDILIYTAYAINILP